MTDQFKKRLLLYALFITGFLAVFIDIYLYNKANKNDEEKYLNIPENQYVLSSQGIKAFPGAEGFGSATPGGRGGQVIKVTNLNDSGEGSFRAALQAMGPRIIVFDIGGVITLNSDLVVSNPYVTIAGQTAPGSGIVIKRGALDIQTHDVIVRGIKARVGDEVGGVTSTVRRGVTLGPPWNNPNASAVYNVIVDHSTISWGVDTNINVWTDSAEHSNVVHDVTFQWNLISEALHDSIHIDEGKSTPAPHSMGATFGKNASNISVHHNLFAHNDDRNARFVGITNGEMINNLIYDWGSGPTRFSEFKSTMHLVNNYYKAGNDSRQAEMVFGSETTYDPGTGLNTYIHPESSFYISGNLTNDPRHGNPVPMDARLQYAESRFLANGLLFTPSGISTHTAPQAYDLVLNYAGATSPVRDSIDQRVISDTINRTGTIINSQNQVEAWSIYTPVSRPAGFDQDNDGIADSWEATYGLNSFLNDSNNDPDSDGYTNIEEYINNLIVMPYGNQSPPMPIAGGGSNSGSGTSTGGTTGGSTGGETGSNGNTQTSPGNGSSSKSGSLNEDSEQASNSDDSDKSPESSDTICSMVALSGKIEYDSDTPLSLNGMIVIVERIDQQAIVSTKSDPTGQWNFSLCAGTYRIIIDVRTLPDGFSLEKEKTITLLPNQSQQIELKLAKETKIEQVATDLSEKVKPHLTSVGTVMLGLSIGGFILSKRFR